MIPHSGSANKSADQINNLGSESAGISMMLEEKEKSNAENLKKSNYADIDR